VLVLYVLVKELFQQSQNVQLSNNADTAKSLPETEVKTQLSKLPRPDVMQMLPFKPKILVRKCSCCGVLFVLLQVLFAKLFDTDTHNKLHFAELLLIFSILCTVFGYDFIDCYCSSLPFATFLWRHYSDAWYLIGLSPSVLLHCCWVTGKTSVHLCYLWLKVLLWNKRRKN